MIGKTELIEDVRSQIDYLKTPNNHDLKKVIDNQIEFLKKLAGLKSIYVRDVITKQDHEFYSYDEIYKFMIELVGHKFDKTLIYKNKSRKMKVCQRFFVSDDSSFSFLKMKKVKKLKTYREIESENKINRLGKKWFDSKTKTS